MNEYSVPLEHLCIQDQVLTKELEVCWVELRIKTIEHKFEVQLDQITWESKYMSVNHPKLITTFTLNVKNSSTVSELTHSVR